MQAPSCTSVKEVRGFYDKLKADVPRDAAELAHLDTQLSGFFGVGYMDAWYERRLSLYRIDKSPYDPKQHTDEVRRGLLTQLEEFYGEVRAAVMFLLNVTLTPIGDEQGDEDFRYLMENMHEPDSTTCGKI
eukprot:GHVN01075955.1.p2 GENE.GHVN01075955.1~~GHVN01075955.1.p2  ORF type:complete len:131 (+),score=31.26 GHVN01075955.1:456-848(+)